MIQMYAALNADTNKDQGLKRSNIMAHDVFISYASQDKLVADAVCSALEAENIRCWCAPRDVPLGEHWAASINNAIKTTSIMVLIFSENSNQSEQVVNELTLAVKSKATVVPFKIDDALPHGVMEYYLAATHWLDAMNPPTKIQINTLVEKIKSGLDVKQAKVAATQVESQEMTASIQEIKQKPKKEASAINKNTGLVCEDAAMPSAAESVIVNEAIKAAAPLIVEEPKIVSQQKKPAVQSNLIKTLRRKRNLIINIAAAALVLIAALVYPMLSNPAIAEIRLSHDSLKMEVNDDIALEVIIEPARAAGAELIWSSSDTNVASVSDMGIVKALGAGSVTIKVEAVDSGKSTECEVIIDYSTGSFSYLVSLTNPDDPERDYINEGLYEGQIKDGLPHSVGIWTGADGSIYDGDWILGKWHGEGTRTWVDGDKYVGEFEDGLSHGQGTLNWADGTQYVGRLKYGLYNGQGTLTRANGEKYVGSFEDGMYNGQGTLTYASGSKYAKYVGEFKNDLFYGQGTLTWADGSLYVGRFEDGKHNGQGAYTGADGGKYVGGWKDGLSHGQGTYTDSDGNKYVGGWKDNLPHGQGTVTFADGEVMSGKWENAEYVGP